MSITWDNILWFVAIVVFVGVELATTSLVSVWFAVGAAAALLLSLVSGVGFAWQVVAFAVVSALVLAFMVPRLSAKRAKNRAPVTNGSPLTIGKQGTVLKALEPGELGRVHVDGLDWQARSEKPMAVGDKCKVRDVDGFVLLVEPVGKSPDVAAG